MLAAVAGMPSSRTHCDVLAPVTASGRMRTRAFLLPTIALALVGQLCAIAHSSVVAHSICEEHGELVDALGDAHDHCVAALSPAEIGGQPHLVTPDTGVPVPLPQPAPRALVVTQSPLDFAPKTSPPA